MIRFSLLTVERAVVGMEQMYGVKAAFANEEHLCKIIAGQNKDLQDFQHPEKLGEKKKYKFPTYNSKHVDKGKRACQLSPRKTYGIEVCKSGSESKGLLWHLAFNSNTQHYPFSKQFCKNKQTQKNNFIVIKIQTLSADVNWQEIQVHSFFLVYICACLAVAI